MKFKLIYKASVDGFDSNHFHSNCDGHKGTLTVIKTSKDYIFGGFTKQDWSGDDLHKCDEDAFVYSLVNPSNTQIKINCTNPENAIYCHPNYGPTFGKLWSCDIYIGDYSNTNNGNHSDLGINYEHPMHTWNSLEAQEFLAGSYYFKTAEIEVYHVDKD